MKKLKLITSSRVKRILYACVLSGMAVMLIVVGIYFVNIYNINQSYYQNRSFRAEHPVALRKFPYPYRAAMTICSDIDDTTTLKEFLEIQKFLNTKDMTSMGKGVNLEIGNSFLMYAPSTCSISYFSEDPEVVKTIIKFVKLGYIDFLHSYGEKDDFSRKDAIAALRELNSNNCKVDVWVDHTMSTDNLGDDITFGFGDHPDSPAYHSDLTLAYGIKFVSLGRGTMIIGQSVPITISTFTNIYDSDHLLYSLVNISKEFAKNVLAVFNNQKYAMHKRNDLVKISTLNDGQKVYEFIRFDNYWKGVGVGATAKGLAYVISEKTLNRLKKVHGYMIVYTHLGKNADLPHYLPKQTRSALRNLANEYKTGNIYITTTSKLLNYYITHKYLKWSYESINGNTLINIHNVEAPIFCPVVPTAQDLQGITFYVPHKGKTRIFIGEREMENIQQNASDYTGRESVTIPPASSGI